MTESTRDQYRTPDYLVRWAEHHYKHKFTLDAAADRRNRKALRYYTADSIVNGLKCDWDRAGFTFCNPPYSRQKKWAQKAIHENRNGCKSFLVVGAPQSDQYFLDVQYHAAEIIMLCGRVQFFLPDGTPTKNNRFGTCLIYFDGEFTTPGQDPREAKVYFAATNTLRRIAHRVDPSLVTNPIGG